MSAAALFASSFEGSKKRLPRLQQGRHRDRPGPGGQAGQAGDAVRADDGQPLRSVRAAGAAAELGLHLDRRLAWPLLALTLSAAQVWLKGPLSNGDFAIAFVNTTNTSTAAAAELGAVGGGGGLSLAACDDKDPAQLWNVSSSANGLLSIASGVRTDGSKQSPPHCVEVNGCNFVVGGKVDTSFGCKKPPQSGNKDKCA